MNFSAPLPGQSLTDKPGNAAWEHPPKYTDLHEALTFVINNIMKADNASKLIMLLEGGAPVDWIVHTVLFSGFTQGLWTPDMIVLMAKPVAAAIIALGKRAHVKNMKVTAPKKPDPSLLMLGNLLTHRQSASGLANQQDNGQDMGQQQDVAQQPRTSLFQRMGA